MSFKYFHSFQSWELHFIFRLEFLLNMSVKVFSYCSHVSLTLSQAKSK